MKRILLFIFLTPAIINAQSVKFNWAKQMVSNGFLDYATAVTVDKEGNVYTTGQFCYTADFDPGPGVYNLTRPYIGYDDFGFDDMFISKLDSAGKFVWAKQIAANTDYQGTEAVSITLDRSGNIYTTGYFTGTIDFDPGSAVHNLTGNFTAFILKLNPQGNFMWVKKIGSDTSFVISNFISLDSSGNIYTTGRFNRSSDFDPGPGVYNLTVAVQDGIDGFISKLDATGNFLWAKQMASGTSSYCIGKQLAFDRSGNVYTTGQFHGTVDFDPGAAVSTFTSGGYTDMFISKFNTTGNFIWTKQMKGNINANGESKGISIHLDSLGNIYSTGNFKGTVDFDPGPAIQNLYSAQDIVGFSKLDSNGNFLWAKKIGISPWNYTFSTSSALDKNGNVYATGHFTDVINLAEPIPLHMFVIKIAPDGNLLWEKQINVFPQPQITPQVYSTSIAVDVMGNVYTSGGFISNVDFDPDQNAYHLTGGEGNIFVHKMAPCLNGTMITTHPVNQNTCPGASATFSVSALAARSYQWQVSIDGGYRFTNITGDTLPSYSISATTLAQNGYYFRCIVWGECGSMVSSSAMLLVNNSSISSQPQSVIVCQGTSAAFTITATETIISYQWQVSTDGVATYSNIPSGTASTYTINSVTSSQNGYYFRCQVTGKCNTITSTPAVLTVISPANINSHPADAETCRGGNANFSVSASSSLPISYQWQVSTNGGASYISITNGGVYSGSTTPALTITGADSSGSNNRYRCQLSTPVCTAPTATNSAVLFVRRPPSVSLSSLPQNSLSPGQSLTLNATTSASSGTTLLYNWYYNNVLFANAGNTHMVTIDKIGTYRVQVNQTWPGNLVCSASSNLVVIEPQQGTELFIYPNPNKGQFKVFYHSTGSFGNKKTINIYDSKGAKVYKKSFSVFGTYTLLNIKSTCVSIGMYMLELIDAKGQRLGAGKFLLE